MNKSRVSRHASVGAALLIAAGTVGAADAPTGGAPDVRAYVLSYFKAAQVDEPGVCEPIADGLLEAYYKTLPPEDQAKYASADKRPALQQEMVRRLGMRITRFTYRQNASGEVLQLPASFKPGQPVTPELALEIAALNGFPKGKGRVAFAGQQLVYTSCSDPYDFQALAKGFKTYDGKQAPGIDLDGKVGKEDFVGPDGQKGVDNQLWRVTGCTKPSRPGGDPNGGAITGAVSPTIIELRGVDDLQNDPSVVVNVYNSADQLVKDARGGALASATFKANSDASTHATVQGRIVNGVLTTDPFEVRIRFKEQIVDVLRHFRGATIRAELQPDGTIKGGLFGYYDINSYYESVEQMTLTGAATSGVNCPAIRRALDELADGYPDPKTGRNTAISAAFEFSGVKAFLVPPKAQTIAANR